MVVVKGHTSVTGGGIYWQLLGFSNPHVLTLFVDSLPPGKRDAPIIGVQYPADESEAWSFDLDAMKERSPTELGHSSTPIGPGTPHTEGVLRGVLLVRSICSGSVRSWVFGPGLCVLRRTP